MRVREDMQVTAIDNGGPTFLRIADPTGSTKIVVWYGCATGYNFERVSKEKKAELEAAYQETNKETTE